MFVRSATPRLRVLGSRQRGKGWGYKQGQLKGLGVYYLRRWVSGEGRGRSFATRMTRWILDFCAGGGGESSM